MHKIDEGLPLLNRLQHLLDMGWLAPAAQQSGKRLLKRLTSDIRVVLAGPEERGKSVVFDVLTTRGLSRAELCLIDWGNDFPRHDADICIWTTQDFGADEQDIWENMPNRLKDHSFLVPVAENSTAAEPFNSPPMDVLEEIAVEEFYGLFPITTLQPDPQRPTPEVERLVREIENIVENERIADADNAQMFLANHPVEEIRPQPNVVILTPQDSKQPVIVTTGEPSIRPRFEEITADLAIYHAALDTIYAHITALEPLMSASTSAEFTQILSICEESVTAIADLFSEYTCTPTGNASIWDDLQSAADEMLLMSLEGDVGPAIAAVTTVLQIKRELEIEVVAQSPLLT